MSANRLLALVALLALLGTSIDHLPAFGITPMRRPISVGATPTPRPTSIVMSSTNSTVCGVDTRFFGNGSACNATETSVDVPASEGGTFTNMTCSQPTDATCTIGFMLRVNAANVTSFTCNSVDTVACSPSSPSPTTFVTSDLLAIRVTDVLETCGSNAPTCTVFYTVP